MHNAKLSGFTFIELAVAMLLSAIVISLTYSAYFVMTRSYENFHHKSDSTSRVMTINELITKDFSRSAGLFRTDSGFSVILDTSVIRYKIDSNMIIRDFKRTDTFKMQIHDLSFNFEGRTVDCTKPDTESRRFDEISFTFIFDKQTIPCHYRKNYDSVNLFKRKTDAFN